MAYVLKAKLADKANYGSKRNISEIKRIVIHYTSNDGDTDENNAKYYSKPLTRKASAHYFVDEDSVTSSVPDTYVAYAVGGSKYNNEGGRLYGIATNKNTLSIEICDNVKNGVVYPSAATIENVISFTKEKMVEYSIDKAHVIRHYDVNGKHCPKYWVDDAKWESEFHSKLTGWAFYNNKWYWLDENGNVVKNTWIKNVSGTWSYVGPNGDALTEWHQLEWEGVVSWYCFDANGNMLKSKWIKYKGKDYYVTSSGAMATNTYIKSTSKNVYYWVNEAGEWEPQWDTSSPNLTRYRLVV